jgi:hypothetical protein
MRTITPEEMTTWLDTLDASAKQYPVVDMETHAVRDAMRTAMGEEDPAAREAEDSGEDGPTRSRGRKHAG